MMLFLPKRELCLAAVSLMLISSAVSGHASSRRPVGRPPAPKSEWQRCEEGWIFTHQLCLLDTGLDEDKAEVFCRDHGAEEARGICVKKPLPSSLESSEEEVDGEGAVSAAPAPSPATPVHQCPSGWTQYEDFCYFHPGNVAKVCELLGATYIFNYCVTRVPHQISTDFMKTVKRLDGIDYDMHRDTRMCCCMGGGLCK